jgi:TonB family protein
MSGTVHYPDSARAKGIEGQCVVGFMVNEEGSVCNVELKQSAGNDELDAEALRVVRAMPRWTPGVQDGKNVRVVYTLPVRFKLEDSEKAKEK